MGLLAHLFPSRVLEKKSDPKEVHILVGNLNYQLQIAAVEHFQKTLDTICGGYKRGGVRRLETAWLILDNKNTRDKNAIRVEIRGRQVGYLSAEAAARYRWQLMERNTPNADGQCQAVIIGGWLSSDGRKGDFEVWLDTPSLIR
jgi:hypothetical protein